MPHFSAPGRSTGTSPWLAWLTLLKEAYQVLTRSPREQECVSPQLLCVWGGPEVSEDKVHSSRSVRILLLTHDAQVKLVFFLRRGILNVVASLTALS